MPGNALDGGAGGGSDLRRTFRVDRIARPALAGVSFGARELPADDPATYVVENLSSAPMRHEARIRVHAPAEEMRRVLPEYWGTIEPIDTESCEFRAGDDDLGWLALRIALFGVDFVVHEPPELADHLRELAGRLSRAAAR